MIQSSSTINLTEYSSISKAAERRATPVVLKLVESLFDSCFLVKSVSDDINESIRTDPPLTPNISKMDSLANLSNLKNTTIGASIDTTDSTSSLDYCSYQNLTTIYEQIKKQKTTKEILRQRQGFKLKLHACVPDLCQFTDLVQIAQADFNQTSTYYRCKLADTREIVTLKVTLKRQLLSVSSIFQAFKERQILSNFKHPYIANLACCFQTEKRLFEVLNIDGVTSLKEELDTNGRLQADECIILAGQIGLAIAALHEKEFSCGELNQNRIIIDSDGNAVLADFILKPQTEDQIKYKTKDWINLGNLLQSCLVDRPDLMTIIDDQDEDSTLSETISKLNWNQLDSLIDALKSLTVDHRNCLGFGIQELFDHPVFEGVDLNKLKSKQISVLNFAQPPLSSSITKQTAYFEGDSPRAGLYGFNSWSYRNITI